MKVLATEDVKVVTIDEKSEGTTRPNFAQDYDVKPEPRNYVNFSKLVLLVLAIIASFLLCLIFARDLWGQKAEKTEIAHPQRQTHRANEGPSHFPFVDDLFENLQDLPFGKDFRGKSDEDEPRVVSKTTKITVHLIPSDGSEPSHNQIEKDGPASSLDGPIEEMMKMMMSMMDADTPPQHQNAIMEKPSMFSDLPMFNHQSSSGHPKLIIVRKLNPSMSAPKEDDFLKNIMDEIFNTPKISNHQQNEPFPFFPLQPVHHHQTSEPLDDGLEKAFPFLKHIMVRSKPIVPSHPKPATPKTNESPESWKQYKHLVSEMATSVDTLLDDASSLKDLVKNSVSKFESAATPAETTEAPQTSEGDAASKEQPTATPQPQVPSNVQQFLKDCEELLSKIIMALTDASVTIKTEDGALDLVTRTDKEGLNQAIDSFIKSVHPSLDEVFEASTKLTKTNGNEKEIPEEIYAGIVKLGKGLIHFGKLIYEKMADLRKTLERLDSSKPQVEVKTSGSEAKNTDLGDISMFPPIVHRRIVIFNSNPSSLIPLKPDEVDNDKTLTI